VRELKVKLCEMSSVLSSFQIYRIIFAAINSVKKCWVYLHRLGLAGYFAVCAKTTLRLGKLAIFSKNQDRYAPQMSPVGVVSLQYMQCYL
jgi:hypothetical protein